ncbi:MAG: hypothetical protein MI920_18860 [Kiloniellales bacterium]|nr:hypothetical protein [Kiloniellales bacterium]
MDLPRHVTPKPLKSGRTGYYFTTPPWARKRPNCPVQSEALPSDPAEMLARAKFLNEMLDAFRTGNDEGAALPGSVAWLERWFLKHRKVTRLSDKTQNDYARWFKLITDLPIEEEDAESGRPVKTIGQFQIRAIDYEIADMIYESLQWVGERRRLRTANAAMAVARLAWRYAIRAGYADVNPFKKMDLDHPKSGTVPATRAQLERFITAADALGLPAVGTAALITFELIQREVDVLGRLSWSDVKPDRIKIVHHKTHKEVWLPLHDEDGELFPGLAARLERTPRRGALVIMRDRASGRKGAKVHLPYDEHLFRKHVRLAREHAGLPDSFTFLSCRHGGMTEAGDSEMTDQELSAFSGRSRATLKVYTHKTEAQKLNALRKRRALRLAEERS